MSKELATVPELLEMSKDQIAKALPKHLSSEKIARIALTEFRTNHQLQKCDPYSFLGAVIQASQLGLEIGNKLGHAYLVPYGRECTLIPGYRGLMELARRSGIVESFSARVVKEKDQFDYGYGLNEYLNHKPVRGDRGNTIYAYAIANLVKGKTQFEVMSLEEIEAIKNRSAAAKKGPWGTDFDEMARKTAVKRLCKYLPLNSELATAIKLDACADEGVSQHNAALIDPNYSYEAKPDGGETLKAIGASLDKEADEKRKEKSLEYFTNKVRELNEADITVEQIEKILKNKIDDIAKLSADQINDAYETLLSI